jgi:glycosyltransferase involved in cell wall biosynthesis
MRHRRVLFLQSQIGLDGRSRISLELIRMLNELEISPDVATFANRSNVEDYQAEAGGDLRFRVLRRWYPFSRGYVPQVLLLNTLSRWGRGGYDLTVNLNDTFYCLPDCAAYLHCICDPLEESALGRLAAGVLSRVAPAKVMGEILVISDFTRERLIRFFPALDGRVLKIHPPCVGREHISSGAGRKTYDVISVGTFAPQKGQFEQLQIAERLRHLRFALAGSVWNRRYFRRCMEYKQSRALDHVDLYPNLERGRLEDLLSQSRVFLHYKRQEGFGITTVEGIARGCIPVVADSGGQREVVPLPELRFRSDEEIPVKLREVLEWDRERVQDGVAALQRHIAGFTVEAFREKMRPVLTRAM